MATHTIFDSKKDVDPPPAVEQLNKLHDAVKASNRVLVHIRSVFPFDLFPNEVIVHESKVDIIYGNFFMSKKVSQIPIENINDVDSSHSILFGSLNFEVVGFHEQPRPVTHLWVKDAMRARKMINGLILCKKEGIDLTHLDLELVKQKVEEIGHT